MSEVMRAAVAASYGHHLAARGGSAQAHRICRVVTGDADPRGRGSNGAPRRTGPRGLRPFPVARRDGVVIWLSREEREIFARFWSASPAGKPRGASPYAMDADLVARAVRGGYARHLVNHPSVTGYRSLHAVRYLAGISGESVTEYTDHSGRAGCLRAREVTCHTNWGRHADPTLGAKGRDLVRLMRLSRAARWRLRDALAHGVRLLDARGRVRWDVVRAWLAPGTRAARREELRVVLVERARVLARIRAEIAALPDDAPATASEGLWEALPPETGAEEFIERSIA